MTPHPPALADITHLIQLAIAPVFLLTAVGTLLNVLANRLGRSIDRRRVLEDQLRLEPAADTPTAVEAHGEIDRLVERIHLVYVAITLAVLSGASVCLLVTVAFIGAFAQLNLNYLVAAIFVFGIVSLTGSFLVFLREIFLAVLVARRRLSQRNERLTKA